MKNKSMKKTEVIEEIAQNKIPKGWQKDLTKFGWKKGRQFIGEMEVYLCLKDHTCAVCGGDGFDPDIRWLRIGCFYELKEVSEKFKKHEESGLYLLPICKACRAYFMFEVLKPFIENKGSLQDKHYSGSGGNYCVNP